MNKYYNNFKSLKVMVDPSFEMNWWSICTTADTILVVYVDRGLLHSNKHFKQWFLEHVWNLLS